MCLAQNLAFVSNIFNSKWWSPLVWLVQSGYSPLALRTSVNFSLPHSSSISLSYTFQKKEETREEAQNPQTSNSKQTQMNWRRKPLKPTKAHWIFCSKPKDLQPSSLPRLAALSLSPVVWISSSGYSLFLPSLTLSLV